MSLSQPPRDAAGIVIPHDHDGIGDLDGVIRRISEEHLAESAIPGKRRLSSKAFSVSTERNGGMSVDLQALILEHGHDPRAYVTTPRFTGSVRFEARQLRAEGLMVGYDPLPDNQCHGEVWGNFTKGLKRRLLVKASWFVSITDVSLG